MGKSSNSPAPAPPASNRPPDTLHVRRFAAPVGGASWSMPFFTILGIAAFLYLGSFWLDAITEASLTKETPVSARGLLDSILNQDIDQARNTLGGLGEVMAAVLGLALTVSSIIVQLAATRFTPHITALFFRARTNLMILGFFVTSSVYVLWVNFSIGHSYLPHWGVLLSMLLMTGSLLLLFPYFAYVFDFLDPEKIVGRIMDDGLQAAAITPHRSSRHVQIRHLRTTQAIEHLADIGLNALQQKDKGIASGAVDSLCEFAVRYGATKASLGDEWFVVTAWHRQNPDFVSLSDESVNDISSRQTWVEWKVMRQYQMLFGEAIGQIKDTCYLLAIDTRRIGEAAGRRGDLHVFDLAIKFFNTYLRAALNASDIRTGYNILHQYRQLAEFAITTAEDAPHDDEGAQALRDRAIQIAKFMRYYSSVGFQRGLTFLAEVIAHDIGTMCELAFKVGSPIHDRLLQVFLAVDEHAETKEQEKSLRGVRRAQVKLATIYLSQGAPEHADRIHDDMLHEPLDRLRSIWHELRNLKSREFWEVNDRGSNFDYLTPEQKEQLSGFFARFKTLQDAPEAGRHPTLSGLVIR